VATAPSEEPTPTAEGPGRSYERLLVFLSVREEEPVLLPWQFESRTRPGGVDRTVDAALLSGETWEAFFEASWSGPPSRAPWRLLPRGEMALIVSESDRLENVIFRQPPNELDLALGNPYVDWSGPRGEGVRVSEAALVVANLRTPGSVVDVSRNWRPAERSPGDWVVLVSGDSLHLILEGETEGAGASYRGWGRIGDRELQWPDLTVAWERVRSFEPARRDVPDAWIWASGNEEVMGNVAVQSSQLVAGEGAGPQLPVDALFLVSGTTTLLGTEYPVWGLVRHRQP